MNDRTLEPVGVAADTVSARKAEGTTFFASRLIAVFGEPSLTRNVATNWLQLGSAIAYSLLITPLVIRALGTEGYGVWSFVNGLTTYADLFYLGLGAALVKFVADYRARNDLAAMSRLCSVVFTVYLSIGALCLAAAIAFSPLVPPLLGAIPQSLSDRVIIATCILLGARITALFAGSVFSGVIFAYGRNDIFKGVMIAFAVIRLALVAMFVRGPHSIVILASVFTIAGWLESITFAVFARAISRGLPIRFVKPRAADLRPLYAFGLLSFCVQVSAKLVSYTDTTVIGIRLGAGDVAVYTLPLQLIEYSRFAVAAIATVLLPQLVAIRAHGSSRELGPSFIRVARMSCALGALLNVNLFFLGRPFLERWVGPAFGTGSAEWILLWLGLASFCQVLSTQVPLPFYQALHELGVPGVVLTVEAFTNLGLSIWLVKPFGPAGVAFATFVPTFGITALILPYHICRRLQLPARETLWEIVRPSLMVGGAATVVLFLLNRWMPEASYGTIALKASATLPVLALVFLAAFPSADRAWVVRKLARFAPSGLTPATTAAAIRRVLGRGADDVAIVNWHQAIVENPGPRGSSQNRIVVPLVIGGTGPIPRAVCWVWTLARLRALDWALNDQSCSIEGRYAVFPDLANPIIVYDLQGPAAQYALANLLPSGTAGVLWQIRERLEAWTGYAMSVSGIIVVIRRT